MSPLLVKPLPSGEIATFTSYLLQLRREIGIRVVDRLFTEEGAPRADFVLWMGLNKRKFMSLKYK